ncbi:LysR family transcriptional regulator [Plasticicumulans lactativorans]|uniref:LysR family transcriptional regulator n=1 Tax=Plasticicumulans lactativorans TaxID=1133106 RepID=A0A4R2LAB8_9GAMM|nr:LysR family transcriptional regulator [Plasticicumulans lactativorans]TCO82357.1 LysR family transcriptional regulator [Plasticicumulans lactativorans]
MARAFEPVHLGSIEVFCRAAELRSFSAAAEALGLTPAAVSRTIARLEGRLGVRLFVRTTRSVNLTSDGELYFRESRQALEQIVEAERAITGNQSTPSGLLRVSVPTTYGHYRLLPLLPAFLARYPKVDIELDISNRNVDFIEEGYDLAIRHGQLADSQLVARTLEDARFGVFAAPAYLRASGTPRTLDELARHRCIQFILPSTGRPMAWSFRQDGADVEWPFSSGLRVGHDVLGCVNLAKAGAGLCQSYHFIVDEALRRGELVEVLQDYGGRTRPFSVLYPQNRHLSARVRAFVDFVSGAVGGRAP